MRINQNGNSIGTNASQTTESKSSKKSEKVRSQQTYDARPKEGSKSVSGDSVKTEISPRAQQMQKAKQLASDAPEVRDAKIAELKQKIQNKSYQVNAEAVADRLVDDHLSMPGA